MHASCSTQRVLLVLAACCVQSCVFLCGWLTGTGQMSFQVDMLYDNFASAMPPKNQRIVSSLVNQSMLPMISAIGSALGPNNETDYIHDATFIRKHPRPFTIIDHDDFGQVCAPPGMGPEFPSAYRFMTEKLQVYEQQPSKLKIMCALYTYPGGVNRTNAILETWGKRCDGFMAASTYTDQATGHVNIQHTSSKEGQTGTYTSIWQRVRSMLAYMYTNYLDDYDFFHICGDDVFIVVENLKLFLESEQIVQAGGGPGYPKPIYIGEVVKASRKYEKLYPKDFHYAGGGPGYTLSRSALKAIGEHILPSCKADSDESYEDLLLSLCLWEELDMRVVHARDVNSSAFLYHGVDIEFLMNWKQSLKWGSSRINTFWRPRMGWEKKLFGHKINEGIDQLSKNSASFHLMKTPAKLRRFEKIVYRSNLPDCSCDGKDEPGKHLPEPFVGHNCTWVLTQYGMYEYTDCPSYNALAKKKRPDCL